MAWPTRRASRVALGGGIVLALVGLSADVTGLSSRPGIGLLQIGMMVVGSAVALWGGLESRPSARRNLGRGLLVLGSIYFSMWLVELLLMYPLNPRRGVQSPMRSMPGLYEKGELVSYRLTPGFRGTFDDGIVQAPVSINSRGDRDDEVRDEVPLEQRLLLVGDSFTFGHALTAEETIAGRIEARSGGTVDAYNLGVMGYGPGDIALRFEESPWWRGRTVYYLFFPNDLQNNNAEPGLITAYEGWGVPTRAPDGHAYTEQEWKALITRVLESGTTSQERFSDSFTLRRLRGTLAALTNRDHRLSGFPDDTYAEENIEAALRYTARMHALAKQRSAHFVVVILPARGEAIADEYSRWTQAYVDGARAQGEELVQMLDRLDAEDYFQHDPHFDASGSDVAAQVILEHFEAAAPSR